MLSQHEPKFNQIRKISLELFWTWIRYWTREIHGSGSRSGHIRLADPDQDLGPSLETNRNPDPLGSGPDPTRYHPHSQHKNTRVHVDQHQNQYS